MSFDRAYFPPAAAAGGPPGGPTPSVGSASSAAGVPRCTVVNDSRGVSCNGFVLQVLRAHDDQPMSTAVVNGVDQLVAQKNTDATIKVSNPFVEKNENKLYCVSLLIDGTLVSRHAVAAGGSVEIEGYSAGASRVRPFQFTKSAALDDPQPEPSKGKGKAKGAKGKRGQEGRGAARADSSKDASLGLIVVRIEEFTKTGASEEDARSPVQPRSELLEQSRLKHGDAGVQALDKKLPILASGGEQRDSGHITRTVPGTIGALVAELTLRYNAIGEEVSRAELRLNPEDEQGDDDDDHDGDEDDTEQVSAGHRNKKPKKEDGGDDDDDVRSHAGFTRDSLSQQ